MHHYNQHQRARLAAELCLPPRQWLICDKDALPFSSSAFDLGEWRIHAGADLALWPLMAGDETAGCLIGSPIDLMATAIVDGPVRLPKIELLDEPEVDRQIGDWMATFAAAFFAVIRQGPNWVLYPSAANSCVYDRQHRIVGTTAAALLTSDEYEQNEQRLDRNFIQEMGISESGWLPAGLTAHHGIHRLLPNHALDLGSFRPRRFWRGATRTGTAPEILVERVAEIASQTITAAARSHRLTVALSAGRDSRAVLALASSVGQSPETFTIAHSGAGLDVTVAREMSQALGLRHSTLAPVKATLAEQERWMHRNGHVVGGVNRILHPTMHVFDRCSAVLAGGFAEIGRGYYWSGRTEAVCDLSPRVLVRRFDLPRHKRILNAVETWLNDVPATDARHALDLAYLEHRLGAWAAPQQTADPRLCLHPGPFQNLEIFDCLMSLPPDWRARSLWIDYIIKTRCPQLSAWPFNQHRERWQQALLFGDKLLSPARLRRQIRRWLSK